MNTYNFNDSNYMNTESYKNFILNNPTSANLNIRTTAANDAIPISDVRIIVSKEIDGNKIIFYDGLTDESGMINDIKLPTPRLTTDDLEVPNSILYDLEAIYASDNIDRIYKILMYPDICVIQNINIVPTMMVASWEVEEYGS